jgi:hypothetical protein
VIAVAWLRTNVLVPAPVLQFRLAALLAAQLFDYATFTLMVGRHGIIAEANPLVAEGFLAYGLPLLAVAKGALVLLVGSIVVVLARERPDRRPRSGLAVSITLLGVGMGLLGGVSNVLAG